MLFYKISLLLRLGYFLIVAPIDARGGDFLHLFAPLPFILDPKATS